MAGVFVMLSSPIPMNLSLPYIIRYNYSIIGVFSTLSVGTLLKFNSFKNNNFDFNDL